MIGCERFELLEAVLVIDVEWVFCEEMHGVGISMDCFTEESGLVVVIVEISHELNIFCSDVQLPRLNEVLNFGHIFVVEEDVSEGVVLGEVEEGVHGSKIRSNDEKVRDEL